MIDYEKLNNYIYANFNVPNDNTTMAPSMLEAILGYAQELPESQQLDFLEKMLGESLTRAELQDCDL